MISFELDLLNSKSGKFRRYPVGNYEPNIVLSNKEYNVVGTRPERHDALDKVTGSANYSADIHLPGMLQGRILRSPHAHAKILSIDTSRAAALDGVKAVVTAADFPKLSSLAVDLGEGALSNRAYVSENCLARDKVLYKGHALAGVAAISSEIAAEALELIDVKYEVLQPVMDGKEAMKSNAPILHERLVTKGGPGATGTLSEGEDGVPTNVGNHFEYTLGDIEKGFGEADIIVERETHTKAVHQGYIEPHSATVDWHASGQVTIWCSSQGQFQVREQSALILGISVSKILVVPLEIGGGFGGKLSVYLEPVAALLSKKSGRPVKITMSRAEVFEGSGPTAGTSILMKIGATKDGKITAADTTMIYEAGAYPGSPLNAGCNCIFAPYDIPNAHIEGYDVVINAPKTSAYRAPGAPAAEFAAEVVIDELCEKLNIDPIEFRRINGAKEGTRRVNGPLFPKIGFLEVLQAAKDHDHYNTPLNGPNRGRGLAVGFWGNGTGPASASASVNPDGTISLVEGSPDIGGSRTVAAMHVAEVLGIESNDVKPLVGDTDSVGYTSSTGGSSVAFKTGWACYEAAQDVKRQMISRAATLWDVNEKDIEYKNGTLTHNSDTALKITFKDLAGQVNSLGGPVIGRAGVNPRGAGGAFAAHIADVEVDPQTGKVTILRYTAIQDVGKAIHPTYVEGQIQGGAVQGIGWALNEAYYFNKDGHMMNATYLDYRMPTSLDLPMIDTVIVEVHNDGHPFGVRGVGEVPIVPPLATLANAIHDATQQRIYELPMSPEIVLNAMKNGKNGHK